MCEDAVILEAFKLIQDAFPNALLLLVPRHPERFDKVAELISKQGFSMARRSHLCVHKEYLEQTHQQLWGLGEWLHLLF